MQSRLRITRVRERDENRAACAAITTVLALEFDLDSNLVTSVVFVSTLISPVTWCSSSHFFTQAD